MNFNMLGLLDLPHTIDPYVLFGINSSHYWNIFARLPNARRALYIGDNFRKPP
jgi:hypothetical protein